MPKKPPLPFAHHCTLGRMLYASRNTVLAISVFVGNTYRTTAMRRCDRLLRAIDRLRSDLDTQLFRDYTAPLTVTDLVTDLVHVYYPGDADKDTTDWDLARACAALAALGKTCHAQVPALWKACPVAIGDRLVRIAQSSTYLAEELPFVVGSPRRARRKKAG